MQKPQLLLVDDDRNLLRVLTYQIRQLGFEVVPVTSALQALALLEQQSFGLVLTDLRMPEMDGLELIRRIRKSDRTRERESERARERGSEGANTPARKRQRK